MENGTVNRTILWIRAFRRSDLRRRRRAHFALYAIALASLSDITLLPLFRSIKGGNRDCVSYSDCASVTLDTHTTLTAYPTGILETPIGFVLVGRFILQFHANLLKLRHGGTSNIQFSLLCVHTGWQPFGKTQAALEMAPSIFSISADTENSCTGAEYREFCIGFRQLVAVVTA